MNKNILLIPVALFVLVGGIYYLFIAKTTPSNGAVADTLISTANYSCDQGKSILASFYKASTTSYGSTKLSLSDNRQLTLGQTVSADGGRYTNADESVVFWIKGRGLTFTENSQETFSGCLQIANNPGNLPQIYKNIDKGFSIRLPLGFTVDENYIYQALGAGRNISGIKFKIPESLALGTNLSKDSYLSIERLSGSADCSASDFLQTGIISKKIIDNNTEYSVASSSDAGAGNRYVETAYAIPGTNPCLAIRYFVHYSVFENYPVGSIKEFSMSSIIDQFDMIRKTLIIK